MFVEQLSTADCWLQSRSSVLVISCHFKAKFSHLTTMKHCCARNGGGFGGNVVAVKMKKRLSMLLLTALLIPWYSTVNSAVPRTKALLQKRPKKQSNSAGDKAEVRLKLLRRASVAKRNVTTSDSVL
jgi:hypothetical protein